MNLVQIQDRLRGMPLQVLQQYANGSNPEVPPYIALSVLKQKQEEMQQYQNSQGAAQGQMPSVKSQLEQKVGALQQQASMMPQGMTQPAAPAPQGPVQMAGGGLTSGNAGSAMKFAEGGIIGFKEGGKGDKYETPYDRARREAEEEGTAGLGNALLYGSAPVAAAGDIAALPISLLRNMFYSGQGEAPGWTPLSDMRARALQGDRMNNAVERNAATTEDTPGPTEKDVLAAMQSQAPNGTGKPYVGMLGAGVQPPATVARPTSAPAAGGIAQRAPSAVGAPAPAGLGSSSIAAMLQKQLGKEPVAPTAEGAAKSVQDINKQFGLDTPAGKEERELIAQMRAQREGQMQDRGLQNLITYLTNARGSNLGETFASGTRASQAEIEKQRADDLAHSQKMYEMVSGLNKANRAEQVGSAGKAATLFGEEQKSAAEADRNRLTALANIHHTDVASAAQIKASQISAAARSGAMDEKQQLAELRALQSSIQAQIKATPFDKKVVGPLQEQLATVNAEIARMAGVGTMSAPPGASNAGGNAALYSKADAILNGKK
jgi:hypothetical protein